MAHEVVPYFYSVLGDWGELEYVGPAYEWDEEIVRGSYEDGGVHELVSARTGACVAALTFGRSDDLDHARRLIAGERPVLDERQRGEARRSGRRSRRAWGSRPRAPDRRERRMDAARSAE